VPEGEAQPPREVIDCSNFFAQKYVNKLNDTEIRLYTDVFVVFDADFCQFRWREYYLSQGVDEGDFEKYYLGEGDFDWETYNSRQIPREIYTYKDWWLDENKGVTSEEYDRFMTGYTFDWAAF
jgi:hypothetical protein